MNKTHIPPVTLSPGMTDADRQAAIAAYGTFAQETLMHRMGLEITDVGYDYACGTLPVEGNVQPLGLFHGGAHVVLAESLASMHAWARAEGRNVVGVDLNATHLRSVTSGTVYGRAQVLHAGRTIISHEVKMTNADGQLLSIVRITNMVLTR